MYENIIPHCLNPKTPSLLMPVPINDPINAPKHNPAIECMPTPTAAPIKVEPITRDEFTVNLTSYLSLTKC